LQPVDARDAGLQAGKNGGRPLNFDLCPRTTLPRGEAYRQARRAGETTRVEFRYRHRDGHYVWLETIAGPLIDADGSIGGYMLVCRDITERQLAEAHRLELAVERERVKTLRQFVDHAAAHDLRTPLTIMKTSLYLLERVDDPEKRQRYLESLSSQIDHLEKVFDNILAMSQIYKVEPELHKQPIDLNKIAREVLMKEEVSAAQKHQTLTLSAERAPLTGDRRRSVRLSRTSSATRFSSRWRVGGSRCAHSGARSRR
jgi:signal transduction histidine kinase